MPHLVIGPLTVLVPLALGVAASPLGLSGAWVLVLARASGLAWLAPGWETPALGGRLRLALCLLLTAALVPAIGPTLSAPAGIAALAQACLAELVIGAALGFTAALVVACARQAGEIVGAQAGLSPAALVNADAGAELSPFGHLYGLVALATFVALDGPLALVGALVESYRVVPAGGLPMTADTAAWAFGQVGQALGLAVQIAAPVALALVLAGIALGLLARVTPTLPFQVLALPMRTVAGLLLVFLGAATLVTALASAWTQVHWLGTMPALE
jgi:flagellar biosynthetic protein FliR